MKYLSKSLIDGMKGVLIKTWQNLFNPLTDPSRFSFIALDYNKIPLTSWRFIVYSVKNSALTPFILMVLSVLLGTFFSIAQSFFLGQLAEAATTKSIVDAGDAIKWLFVVWALVPLTLHFHEVANLVGGPNVRLSVQDVLMSRLLHSSILHIEDRNHGELVQKITQASVSCQSLMPLTSRALIKMGSILITVTLLLFQYSHLISGFFFCWMVTSLILSFFLAQFGISIVENDRDTQSSIIGMMNDLISNISLVRTFLNHDYERDNFRKLFDADIKCSRDVRSYWVFIGIIELIYKWVFGFVVLGWSYFAYVNGWIEFKVLIVISTLVITVSMHFDDVAYNFVDIFEAIGSLQSCLKDFRSLPTELSMHNGEHLEVKNGSISFNNVCFQYPSGLKVLNGISFEIQGGRSTALIGISGAGKSTIIKLIKREVLPSSGSILFDSLNSANFSLSSLLSALSEVSQTSPMLHRSIRDNIAYGKVTATEAEILKVIEESDCVSLINKMPGGLNSVIGDKGSKISGGERQRIAMARAFLKRSPILILDEATASLDSISENTVLGRIREDSKKITVVAIAHRLSSIKDFDHIIVIDKGVVAEQGCHSHLLSNGIIYRKLWDAQTKERENEIIE
jgi:ATP-binding cassette, subfamily B, bacterial